MPISRTTGIAIALGLILLAAAAYLLMRPADAPSVTTTGGAPGSEAEAVFLSLTSQLDPVTFDTTILKDARFAALVDIRTAILPEPSGRSDPFGPLPGVSIK
jgi:hypothetical protein